MSQPMTLPGSQSAKSVKSVFENPERRISNHGIHGFRGFRGWCKNRAAGPLASVRAKSYRHQYGMIVVPFPA